MLGRLTESFLPEPKISTVRWPNAVGCCRESAVACTSDLSATNGEESEHRTHICPATLPQRPNNVGVRLVVSELDVE
ncbi:hypothetical protein FHT76_005364 [Rhizobium sp. BK176]|nr:hypothetical protein [Rhizobium sp. BK661]MCS4093670.1 hypothetical protein [Rhizobium sp. BK176]